MSTLHPLRAATAVHVLWVTSRDRVQDRVSSARHRDEGLTTLEIVIWGVGLFAIAGVAVGVITAAIRARTSQIT